MAIATYSDLQSAIGSWLNRADMTARIPDFIMLAQNRIIYGSQEAPFQTSPLRVRQMETTTTISTTSQTVALPTRFLRAKRMYNADGLNTSDIEMATPDYIWGHYSNAQNSGRPKFYTVEGENFVFGPFPDTTYTLNLLYYEAPAPFVFDTDTDGILTSNPAIYLWASLLEAWSFIQHPMAETAHKKFVGAMNAMQISDGQDRYSGQWVARGDTGNP